MQQNKPILPHQSDNLFLTDGGLETTLIFHLGFELPYFAAFPLLKDDAGYSAIRDYYRRYLEIARDFKTGFILETPTWRANPDWIEKLGYPSEAITDINRNAVRFLMDLKAEFADSIPDIIISGCVGPRGDGYVTGKKMTAEEAQVYHSAQIGVFSQTPVDIITVFTLNYAEEAIGIVQAANAVNLPVVVSFTVETDGKLPSGMTLKDAVTLVDSSVTKPPVYYMINCAHPTHFMPELQNNAGQPWLSRLKGIRANASCKSHAQLDEATELDSGNPAEMGEENKQLKNMFKRLNVFGGCCGTDERHVLEIARKISTSSY